MALRDAFTVGGANLHDFLTEFRMDVGPFLAALREAGAIVTGLPVIVFAAGLWSRRYEVSPGAHVLDVLYTRSEARSYLLRVWEGAGYVRVPTRCCHLWGEWKGFPRDKIVCLSRGRWMQRAVHLIELPRGPVETVLSRVYGCMPGTYLTGGGRLVCLFPGLILEKKRCWVPAQFEYDARAHIQFKYRPWRILEDEELEDSMTEVSAVGRTVSDAFTWSISFDINDGTLLPERERDGSITRFVLLVVRLVVLLTRWGSLLIQQGSLRWELTDGDRQFALCFPNVRASFNANGNMFDVSFWKWSQDDCLSRRQYIHTSFV